jgi:hypothetical protein
MDKVYIVTITSSDDGNVEVTTKLFSTFEKATGYLYSQYIEIKAENASDDDLQYANDYIEKVGENASNMFYIEDVTGNYWCNGIIDKKPVE